MNGQRFIAKTTFNVLKPTAKIYATGGTVGLDTNAYPPYTTLHCGSPVVGSVGMLFSNNVIAPSGYSGNINLEWVQIITNLLRRVQTNDEPAIWYHETATNVLDTLYPYPFNQPALPYPCTSDTPHSDQIAYYQAISYSDSFDMWLMFKPDGVNSKWVPLRKVSWHWDGAGSKYGITWTLDSHTDPGNPNDIETSNFPTWTDNIAYHHFEQE